jgi:hypothetical protein
MARFGPGRMLRQSFFTSADLTDQPFWFQLFFAGLFAFADDQGNIRHNLGFFRGTLLCSNGARRAPKKERIMWALGLLEYRRCLSAVPPRSAPGTSVGSLEVISHWHITNFDSHQDITAMRRLCNKDGNQWNGSKGKGTQGADAHPSREGGSQTEEQKDRSRGKTPEERLEAVRRKRTEETLADIRQHRAEAENDKEDLPDIGSELKKAKAALIAKRGKGTA